MEGSVLYMNKRKPLTLEWRRGEEEQLVDRLVTCEPIEN